MTPFRIDVAQSDIDDLRERLARTRWSPRLPGEGWQRGVPAEDLRALAEYWRTGFDWRAQERRLNEFPQFTDEIDGQNIHFLQVRSARPDAFPLILTHGWPNSFLEFADLIGPLTERGFDVVVPSVPGFGFSEPPRDTGWTAARVAGIWAELMRRLGYHRYGAQGGDFGAYVAPELARVAPAQVAGVYINAGLGFPGEADLPEMTEDERAAFAKMREMDWMTGVDHHALLRAAPQTFGYGWHDSPVAALAWMLQKMHEFNTSPRPVEQVLGRDAILTNVSLYWFTRTFASSAWPYYDSTGFAWPAGQTAVPTGVFSGPPGIRRFAERTNRIIHWPEHNAAEHHFAAMDVPRALADDMATFFAQVR
jgi:pimeloyl-ACP methyl ester carboxylesterase